MCANGSKMNSTTSLEENLLLENKWRPTVGLSSLSETVQFNHKNLANGCKVIQTILAWQSMISSFVDMMGKEMCHHHQIDLKEFRLEQKLT